jgi:hypothetical protein
MHIETQSFIAIIEIEMENTGTIIQKAFKKNRMVLLNRYFKISKTLTTNMKHRCHKSVDI